MDNKLFSSIDNIYNLFDNIITNNIISDVKQLKEILNDNIELNNKLKLEKEIINKLNTDICNLNEYIKTKDKYILELEVLVEKQNNKINDLEIDLNNLSKVSFIV
jgi:septal ring factor EnvC (AmiA/AmiB activator)